MKTLELNEIRKALGLSEHDYNPKITYVSNDILKIAEQTVVFHLNKDIEIDTTKLSQLKDCYIVTDQATLFDMMVNEDQFLFVEDVHRAYTIFTEYYRGLFELPIIAVTGTSGKTTTKEMIAKILNPSKNVASTISNKNNLGFNHDYLLSIDEHTEVGVFETAISYPGNLITSCSLFKPSIGIITTIGIDHLSGCKTHLNYVRTKSEMLAGLGYKGTLILNADDLNIKRINLGPFKGKVITFGTTEDAHFRAVDLEYTLSGMKFKLLHEGHEYEVTVPGYGEHTVLNACAALAGVTACGLDLGSAIERLSTIKHIRSHLEILQGPKGSTLIDDTWSSNPTSTNAALQVLYELGKEKVKIAVLGKIAYLGEEANKYYDEIAQMVLTHEVDFLLTIDSFSKHIGKQAVELGFKASHVFHCENSDDLLYTLNILLNEKAIALFKMSMFDRSAQTILKQLIQK